MGRLRCAVGVVRDILLHWFLQDKNIDGAQSLECTKRQISPIGKATTYMLCYTKVSSSPNIFVDADENGPFNVAAPLLR